MAAVFVTGEDAGGGVLSLLLLAELPGFDGSKSSSFHTFFQTAPKLSLSSLAPVTGVVLLDGGAGDPPFISCCNNDCVC